MNGVNWAKNEVTDDVFEFKGSKERTRSNSNESVPSRKRSKPNNKKDCEKQSKPEKKVIEIETDPDVLQRRQKQIDYGKNTVGYEMYTQKVPFDQRTKGDPKTPDKYCKYSRRSWDMLIKMWRKSLHKYDIEECGIKEERIKKEEEDSDED
ncbi:histone RNA hairpin-binding protein [Aricia agestis]|uniref:histone RNA hairpin-binding protein n=1 Tax=Aricia agestis TaxID=91739 RepID=UPI001C20B518|nr:histone RNA hairpin-binding protein [Aricia agestis]XP_041979049.1 histone RNA hairpin-binding protein [Aricia agestis]